MGSCLPICWSALGSWREPLTRSSKNAKGMESRIQWNPSRWEVSEATEVSAFIAAILSLRSRSHHRLLNRSWRGFRGFTGIPLLWATRRLRRRWNGSRRHDGALPLRFRGRSGISSWQGAVASGIRGTAPESLPFGWTSRGGSKDHL